MMKTRKNWKMLFLIVAATTLVVVSSLPAQAVTVVQQDFVTTIFSADPSNPFGINDGDEFISTAWYTLDLLSPADSIQSFETDPNLRLSIRIGPNLVLNENFDIGWTAFPELRLNSEFGLMEMAFVADFNYGPPATPGFDYRLTADALFLPDPDPNQPPQPFVVDDLNGALDLVVGDFTLPDGTFDPTDPAHQVPVPAAVWLFGSGLVCLVGIRRRLKN